MRKPTFRIEYPHWGRAAADKFWQMICVDPGDSEFVAGELYDYHVKKNLVDECIKNNYHYEVFRHHRDGRISIVDSDDKSKIGAFK